MTHVELERRLKSERPQPPDEFVSALALVSRRRRPGLRRGASLAGGFTALLLVAFALTGGIGYAASAVQGGTTAVADLVTGPSNDSQPSNGEQGRQRQQRNNGNANGNGDNGNGNNGNNGDTSTTGPRPDEQRQRPSAERQAARTRPRSATSRPGTRTTPRRSR